MPAERAPVKVRIISLGSTSFRSVRLIQTSSESVFNFSKIGFTSPCSAVSVPSTSSSVASDRFTCVVLPKASVSVTFERSTGAIPNAGRSRSVIFNGRHPSVRLRSAMTHWYARARIRGAPASLPCRSSPDSGNSTSSMCERRGHGVFFNSKLRSAQIELTSANLWPPRLGSKALVETAWAAKPNPAKSTNKRLARITFDRSRFQRKTLRTFTWPTRSWASSMVCWIISREYPWASALSRSESSMAVMSRSRSNSGCRFSSTSASEVYERSLLSNR